MATQAGTRFPIGVVISVDGKGARIARQSSPFVRFGLPTADFAAFPAPVGWSLLNLQQRRDEPWI